MAQELIPKYDYFVVYTHGYSTDMKAAFEKFNAEIERMVSQGWQAEGEYQVTNIQGYNQNLLITQQMHRYSTGYEKYHGYHDLRRLISE